MAYQRIAPLLQQIGETIPTLLIMLVFLLTRSSYLPSARLPSREEQEEIHIMVVNEDTNVPAEDGIEGEIWVLSPSNTSGYLGHPFLILEVFQKRFRNNLSHCFVRTGDRGIVKGEERFLFITGPCSDVIKLSNNQETHAHYIEIAAYNSCPQFLRGGCLAAFMTSTTIVLVAEMQRTGEVDKIVLRNAYERIRQAVLDEEKIELGLVVLVRSGSVPKTTSGKVQRWAAKLRFVQGRMSAVMEMRFKERCNLSSFGAKIHGSRGKGSGGYGRKGIAEGAGEVFFSLSSDPSRCPSLLSLL